MNFRYVGGWEIYLGARRDQVFYQPFFILFPPAATFAPHPLFVFIPLYAGSFGTLSGTLCNKKKLPYL